MSKKLLIYIVIPFILTSCEKIYINGDLDGMWKLEKVVKGDSVEYPANICYSFQRHLVMLGEYYAEGFPDYYMAEFDYTDSIITMTKFYKYPGRDDTCDMEELKKYYIFSDTMVFVVDNMGNDNLFMHTKERKYYFRKW
ncbi:MAG: lipocalin-like domain-containing protein [Bacteroidaceae bacterium]|nr:lipocalin-like domain-containing protein [Bacteroidaceae bacterium]